MSSSLLFSFVTTFLCDSLEIMLYERWKHGEDNEESPHLIDSLSWNEESKRLRSNRPGHSWLNQSEIEIPIPPLGHQNSSRPSAFSF